MKLTEFAVPFFPQGIGSVPHHSEVFKFPRALRCQSTATMKITGVVEQIASTTDRNIGMTVLPDKFL